MASSGFLSNGLDFDTQFVRREFFSEGTLWGWGQNSYGQLGNGSAVSSNKFSSPIIATGGGLTWTSINADASAGSNGVVGTKSDGLFYVWGYNSSGALGNGNSATQTAPTFMSPVQYRQNWKKISISAFHTIGIWNNTLWAVGGNAYGQIGDGTSTARGTWTQIPGLTWADSEARWGSSAAIRTDGTLWTWGKNNYGQLGDNTTVNKSSPVQITGGGTNWKYLQHGGMFWFSAIKTDNTLWLWGQNNYGQLGDNSLVNKSSPVQISGGGEWKQVAGGGRNLTSSLGGFAAGIKNNNTLWLWGNNSSGQLGDNTVTNKSTPVQIISGGNNWKQVSCGYRHTAAIKTDGTLWTWGYNNYGELGDNTRTNKSSPVQTVAGGTNWKQVQACAEVTLGLTDNLM